MPIITAVPNPSGGPRDRHGRDDREGPPPGVPVLVPMPHLREGGPHPEEAFTIDCADCCHRRTAVCDDCVVSFIVDRQPDDAVVVDAEEARAVRLLEQAGLVPGVRHSRQASGL